MGHEFVLVATLAEIFMLQGSNITCLALGKGANCGMQQTTKGREGRLEDLIREFRNLESLYT
jgi:hypothetical protein